MSFEDISLVIVVALSLAFFVSFCINVILCIKQRSVLCKDKDECCYSHNSEGESLSQMERGYFHDLNHQEQQENPHNHHEQQENPIYGNISTLRSDSADDCYEMMTLQRTRNCTKPVEPDLNYASLDLKKAKKRKRKHCNVQGQLQGRQRLQDQPPDHVAPPADVSREVDADMDTHLPPRDTSTMVSHSSIYLNSQQIAQETEEMERERTVNTDEENMGWDVDQERAEGGYGEWEGDQEKEERKDEPYGNSGDICALLSEVEAS